MATTLFLNKVLVRFPKHRSIAKVLVDSQFFNSITNEDEIKKPTLDSYALRVNPLRENNLECIS